MNEYDSNRILDVTKKINYSLTENLSEAKCYILNTCHIREKATDKVYHDIGRVKKEFRNKKKPIVLITGCVAQAEGDILLEREKYIDAIVGPQSYHEINKIILSIKDKDKKINLTEFEAIEKFDELKFVFVWAIGSLPWSSTVNSVLVSVSLMISDSVSCFSFAILCSIFLQEYYFNLSTRLW